MSAMAMYDFGWNGVYDSEVQRERERRGDIDIDGDVLDLPPWAPQMIWEDPRDPQTIAAASASAARIPQDTAGRSDALPPWLDRTSLGTSFDRGAFAALDAELLHHPMRAFADVCWAQAVLDRDSTEHEPALESESHAPPESGDDELILERHEYEYLYRVDADPTPPRRASPPAELDRPPMPMPFADKLNTTPLSLPPRCFEALHVPVSAHAAQYLHAPYPPRSLKPKPDSDADSNWYPSPPPSYPQVPRIDTAHRDMYADMDAKYATAPPFSAGALSTFNVGAGALPPFSAGGVADPSEAIGFFPTRPADRHGRRRFFSFAAFPSSLRPLRVARV
ncbi:hypothetical protein FB451DRAFT_510602 [Mycena latifolia]|nr:hypothetical protein FB451DRAFT_510602 [Mycena latifolia]